MKFTELKECPYCGSKEYYRKEYAYGPIAFAERFDGDEADNSDLYEGLSFRYASERVYCRRCCKYLGNKLADTVAKSAEKVIAHKEK